MAELVVTLGMVGAFAVLVVVARRRQHDRRGRAATTELVADADGIRRTLADGRTEEARWASVTSVEVVCTPVRTIDGTKVFVLIAEDSSPEDPRGCLVPVGVGHDDALVTGLARLPGFRFEAYLAAQEHRPPRRTIVWSRPAPASAPAPTPASA